MPLRTWGICTRRAGKLYRARSRLSRSLLQFNTGTKILVLIWKLSPRSTQYTPLQSLNSIWKPWKALLESVIRANNQAPALSNPNLSIKCCQRLLHFSNMSLHDVNEICSMFARCWRIFFRLLPKCNLRRGSYRGSGLRAPIAYEFEDAC